MKPSTIAAPCDNSAFTIEAEQDVYAFPASFAQQRVWLHDQFHPDDAAYNIPAAFAIVGPLDTTVLELCLATVVHRHESLRTTFAVWDGELTQIVDPSTTLDLVVEDLSWTPAEDRYAKALELASAEARRPFDLTRGPLVRVRLLRLREDHHFLLLTLHHIIADGWSLGVLFGELAALYRALVPASPHRCRTSLSSTPTMRPGSGNGCKATSSTPS